MGVDEGTYQQQNDDYYKIRIEDKINFSHTQGLINELESKIEVLPKVDKYGNSECPFAERVYAQKEEAEKKLVEELGTLEECAALIPKELARCRRNSKRIFGAAKSLNLQEPRSQFLVAETVEDARYKEVTRYHEEVQLMIKKVKETLKKSQAKKFPGKIPQNLPAFPGRSSLPPPFAGVATPGSSCIPGPANSTSAGTTPDPAPAVSIGKELDGLISLGPIGRKKSEEH